jgi:hypothetical protein
MSDAEQMGFDIEFDEKTQAFLDWVAPERMESQIRSFLTTTVPGIADYDDRWWKPVMLTRLLDATLKLFGDWSAFSAPANRDHADQFVRFLGECCIKQHPGMAWTNEPESGAPLYTDFGPAVHFTDNGLGETVLPLVRELFMENYGPRMVEYSIQKAGVPI